ncbi:hypothetical protein BMETH_2303_1 [methanotrophic bacterial endosymbiont of Bathymodiolus sp.]|nr:hypothetical protein BMETH_2303_1 [methanotrophic bacterial endosymbiont of Bathymodiolus sp.]
MIGLMPFVWKVEAIVCVKQTDYSPTPVYPAPHSLDTLVSL